MCGKRSVNLSVCGPLSLVTAQSNTISRLSLIQTNVSDSDTTKVCAIDDVANTGCPTKNDTLFWRAVAPLNFELGIKVRGVLESSGSQLFKTVPTFDF